MTDIIRNLNPSPYFVTPHVAAPSFSQLYSQAMQAQNYREAYDYARAIPNDENRLAKTKEITQMLVDQRQLDALVNIMTYHPSSATRNCDSNKIERYTIAFQACGEADLLDDLIVKILTHYKTPDYEQQPCNNRYDDYAVFAKACLDYNDQLFIRVLTEDQFPTSVDGEVKGKMNALTLFSALSQNYKIADLNPQAISQIRVNSLLKNAFNITFSDQDERAFLDRLIDSPTIEYGKDLLTRRYEKLGRESLTPDFLGELFKVNQAYLLHAYSLMRQNPQMPDYA